MSVRPLPRLIVITDAGLDEGRLLTALEALRPLGARVAIQLRAPSLGARALLGMGRRILERVGPDGPPLFVNGRLDVALALGAHLHLPEASLDAVSVRRYLPAGRWISAAVHEGSVQRAVGADLALVSPVFAPGSKPDDTRPQLGVGGLRRLASALPCPAYALGGISEATLPGLAGVAGAAVVSAVLKADRPRVAAEALLAQLEG